MAPDSAPSFEGLGSLFGCTPRPNLPDWLRGQVCGFAFVLSPCIGSVATVSVKGLSRHKRLPPALRVPPFIPRPLDTALRLIRTHHGYASTQLTKSSGNRPLSTIDMTSPLPTASERPRNAEGLRTRTKAAKPN